MKTVALFKRIMAAAAVAMVLASCAKEEQEVPVPKAVSEGPYTFLIGDAPSTRLLLGSGERGRFGLWEKGDRVGTVLSASGSVTCGYASVTPGTPVSFRLYRYGGFEGGELVQAYYPYNSGTRDATAVKMSIPSFQTQDQSGFDFDAMPLVSNVYEVTGPVTDNFNPVGELYFANLAAVAQFRIFSSNSAYASETVSSVVFESSAPLAGSFEADITRMDIYDPSTLVISGYSESSAATSLSVPAQVGATLDGATSVYMVLAPGSYSGRVTVVTDKATYTFTLKSPLEFRRSVIKGLGVDLATGSRQTDIDPRFPYLNCYEVPAIDVTGPPTPGYYSTFEDNWYRWNTSSQTQCIVTHTFNNDSNKRLRNYTVLYDGEKHSPVWISFVMHADAYEDNNAGRNDSWRYDPAIDEEWQQSGLKNANSVGYSRGHFVASNYRQTTYNQNRQTFYNSNQAPQWQNSFNGGIWSSLEGAVKAASPEGRDTLYVVVGVLFEGDKTLPSNDGKDVPIPSHFYKCVMKCSFDAGGTVTAASGVAYLFTNEAHGGGYNDSQYVTSIDAIEQRTGFDFFPRVPSALQSAAESSTSPIF